MVSFLPFLSLIVLALENIQQGQKVLASPWKLILQEVFEVLIDDGSVWFTSRFQFIVTALHYMLLNPSFVKTFDYRTEDKDKSRRARLLFSYIASLIST